MAAYVGLRGGIDPEPTVKAVVGTGNELIAAARDPVHKAQLQWDLGMALYDAVQICQMRSDHDNALKYGEQAAEYLAKANETKHIAGFGLPAGPALLPAGHASTRCATTTIAPRSPGSTRPFRCWNARRPRNSPPIWAATARRSSAWAFPTGKPASGRKAVALTEKGIKWMEQAVKQGTLDRSALAVPYNNLAAMHRKLGSTDKADRFQEMASRAKNEKLK